MRKVREMNTRILGLDPGLANFGWAIYHTDEGYTESGVIETDKKLPDYKRMWQILETLDVVRCSHEIDALAVELMILNGSVKPNPLKVYAARMCAVVQMATPSVDFAEYNATATKKRLLGTGVADKKTMKKKVIEWFDLEDKNLKEHQYDSYAQIAMYILDREIDCPARERIMDIIDFSGKAHKCKK